MKLGRNINVVFESDSVLYFEGDGTYSIIHFRHGKKQTYARNIKYIHDLVGEAFVRIHQKYLVNRAFIKAYYPDSVVLCNGIELTISRRRQNKVKPL
jgi:DNA-binding LytR/AlgR family response regulator